MKLILKSLDEVSAAVAEHVAGWSYWTFPEGACPHVKHWRRADATPVTIHSAEGQFARSADAVLPLLEKWSIATALYSSGEWTVSDDHMDCLSDNMATDKSFPLAACLALLRAKGFDVEFTP